MDFRLQGTVASINGYSTSTDCQTHLQAFTNGHVDTADIDAYQLFTGINLASCYGYAWIPSVNGQFAVDRDSVVEARDHSTADIYDPANRNHLGAISGQEIAHNWGERNHPQDFHNTWNIMAGAGDRWNQVGFWFTSGNTQTTAGYIRAAWGS